MTQGSLDAKLKGRSLGLKRLANGCCQVLHVALSSRELKM